MFAYYWSFGTAKLWGNMLGVEQYSAGPHEIIVNDVILKELTLNLLFSFLHRIHHFATLCLRLYVHMKDFSISKLSLFLLLSIRQEQRY